MEQVDGAPFAQGQKVRTKQRGVGYVVKVNRDRYGWDVLVEPVRPPGQMMRPYQAYWIDSNWIEAVPEEEL